MSQPSHMPNTQPQIKLFVQSNGIGLKFFVETAAVQERPKLVRRIQKYGGSIVSSAREADLLLAENNTKEALEILDAWSADKVVLSTRWVGRCIDTNEFLGKERNWGELSLNRDQIREFCIDIDDEYQDTKDLALEGWNETVKSVRKKRNSTKAATVSSGHPQTNGTPVSSSSRVEVDTPPSKRRRVVSDHTSDYNEVTQLPTLFHQTDMSATSSNFPQEALSDLSTTRDLQAVVQQQAFIINYFNGLLQQPLQQNLLASSGSTANLMNATQATHLQGSPQGLQQFGVPHQMLFNPAMFTPRTESPDEFIIGQPRFGSQAILMSNTQNSQTMPSRTTPDDAELVSEGHSTQSEGEVEITVLDKKRKRKAHQPSSSPFEDEPIQTAIRSNPPRMRSSIRSVKGGIFTHDKALPSKFFVTLDLRIRKELLQIIRKHGGSIVLRMEDADYIILNNRSPQFQGCLGLLPLNKIALSPTWLQECDRIGAVVSLAGHIIDVDSGHGPGAARKKPGPTARSQKSKPADDEYESEEGVPEPPSSSQTSMRTPRTMPLRTQAPRNFGQKSRSPSPPAILVSTGGGHHLFTKEDREWFFQYARFKRGQNPKLSTTQLMKFVGRKAPHHSTSSWQTTVRTKWKDELDALEQEFRHRRLDVVTPSPSQKQMEDIQQLAKSSIVPSVVTPSRPNAAAISGIDLLDGHLNVPETRHAGSFGSMADPLPIERRGSESITPQNDVGPFVLGQTEGSSNPVFKDEVIDIDDLYGSG